MLTTQPKKKRAANKMYLVVLSIYSVFLYLFVLWAFSPSAVKMMKFFFYFFYLHVFSEVVASWTLSATVHLSEFT